MILLFTLLIGCGWMEGSTSPEAQKSIGQPGNYPPMTANERPDECELVFTADDANRFFMFGGSLQNVGDCKFENVRAEHSTMYLSFETRPKKPVADPGAPADAPPPEPEKHEPVEAKITVTPSECVKDGAKAGLVAGAYTLTGVDEARAICPEGIDALVAAFNAKQAPAASKPK